jgi:predicted DNA binding CopG/RHH family protein
MKIPKINDLKLNKEATLKMRKKIKLAKKVKITINFDEDLVQAVRAMAHDKGMHYQTLLNKILKDALTNKEDEQSRLDKLEKEILAIKKKLAA